MNYPTLEQYNEALQAPHLALTDPELRQGAIATTGLGLPLALCGGFALTYTVTTGAKKHAVRCFHKQSNALERRYSAISRRLKALRSPYFVDFEFQPQGVRVAGGTFPVVKMAWAGGTTLGEFVERRHRSPASLQQLRASLRALAKYLESQGMAHGDIQPGNVMVADDGRRIQLIDYDGIYVEELKPLGSAELGHRNFQHPRRSSSSWDASLDRFSFITIDLSLRALEAHPDLWAKTRSDGDSFLLKANDFADPGHSSIVRELIGKSALGEDAKNFVRVCGAPYEKTPTLEAFLAKVDIPQVTVSIKPVSQGAAQYLSAFPVLDATNYANCLSFVGDKVELVGRIVEVKQDRTRHGKSYVFINFGPWQGHIVKIAIWSEGLAALSDKPSQGWVGKWISVVGLLEPPYVSRKYKYSHLAISITQGSQLHVITEPEARFRLAGSSTRGAGRGAAGNREVLDEMLGKRATSGRHVPKPTHPALGQPQGGTANQAVLSNMRAHGQQGARAPGPVSSGVPQSTTSSKCFIASAVYGADAKETDVLRSWRDNVLLRSRAGRAFTSTYYRLSPGIAGVVKRSPGLRLVVRLILDRVVRAVRQRERS